MTFRDEMIREFWQYVEDYKPDLRKYLDGAEITTTRPPVFQKMHAQRNLLLDPHLGFFKHRKIKSLIPNTERHRWFRSMSSSQAFAQSFFGNLIQLGEIDSLTELTDEDGLPLLGSWVGWKRDVYLEYSVGWLGEPRPTSLDVFFSGRYNVAVECKLTEDDVGRCSRPELDYDNKYYCQGKYAFQQGRETPCPLTEVGVKYWEYIPSIFKWQNEYHDPCPLRKPYQLVRNVLAAVVRSDSKIKMENGHALLLYDERNPAFKPGGDAF